MTIEEGVLRSTTGATAEITAPSSDFLVFVYGYNTSRHTGTTSVSLPSGVLGSVIDLAKNTGNYNSHAGVFRVQCPVGTTVSVYTTGNSGGGYSQIYTCDIV